jgi:hypothetical protein
MGKAQRLEDLLQELAIYEATVSNWSESEGQPERIVTGH